MENIWFTSDSHFGHTKILEYCSRPFKTIEEMDEILIENWNKKVKKNDKIFVLGDFALCGKDKIIEIGQRLNGYKILLWGNHEHASLKTYFEAGFKLIYKSPFLYDEQFICSHIPRFNCKYPNIHGHIHQKNIIELENFSGDSSMFFNVGVDMNNFYPVNYENIKKKFLEV